MKKKRKSLLQQLKWTVLGLCAGLIILWLLFYLYMNFAIKRYTMNHMERVAKSIIITLEQTFLELEDLSFAVSENDVIRDFLTTENKLLFHSKAVKVMEELKKVVNKNMLAENLLLYNHQGVYYRFYGNISNTAAKNIFYKAKKELDSKQIQLAVVNLNYIGYIDTIYYGNENLGKMVLLIEENDILRLFQTAGVLQNMRIGLTANQKIIVANDEKLIGTEVEKIMQTTDEMLQRKIGFTPLGLIIIYQNTYEGIILLFMAAVMLTALLLGFMIRTFLLFWKNKFFMPIQDIIEEVEKFEGEALEIRISSDLDYFDGLVKGINEMLYRIEQKEAELFQATFSLQEAEIKKQKALIVSLKKQINAHFTVNILNIIKVLSSSGENEKAGLMCDGLSYLLRYANGGESMVNALEEFFVLNKYLEIMQIRYPDRFTAEVDMEDFLETIRMPRMLLQPIVENSILHGFKERKSNQDNEVNIRENITGKIFVSCIKKEDKLLFIVEDNGIGIEKELLEHILMKLDNVRVEDEIEIEGVSNVALVNIQRRVRLYFGKEYGLEIASKVGEGTKVVLSLPIHHNLAAM